MGGFLLRTNYFYGMQHDTTAFESTAILLKQLSFSILQQDLSRPWGGFYAIDETQSQAFAAAFFPDEDFEALKISEKLSPKILMVAPHKRLSWQYHHRRAELWRCLEGEVAVVTSHSDEEEEQHILKVGYKIRLQQGERHRLIGLDDWGIVAEIWQHTDAQTSFG